MLVLEKKPRYMMVESSAGLKPHLTVVDYDKDKAIRTNDAPTKSRPVTTGSNMDVDDILEQELRAFYRQELLMF